MSEIKSVSVWLYSSDMERSIKFYTEILGFKGYERGETNAMVALDGQALLLCNEWTPVHKFKKSLEYPLGRGCQFNFEVSDLEALKDRLKSDEIELFTPEWTCDHPESKTVANIIGVLDPDGYVLSFQEIRKKH